MPGYEIANARVTHGHQLHCNTANQQHNEELSSLQTDSKIVENVI